MIPTFYIKKGDLLPAIQATLKATDGTALNLTGATVAFKMKLREAANPKVNAAGTVVDAATGVVKYVWQGTDTDTVGVYDAEWILTFSGNKQTVPSNGYFRVSVEAPLS